MSVNVSTNAVMGCGRTLTLIMSGKTKTVCAKIVPSYAEQSA
jgi:hypothetical protein